MKKHLVKAVAVVVIAGIGFAGGVSYAKSKAPAPVAIQNTAGQQQRAPGGPRGGRNNGGLVAGSIIASDATSITVQTNGGGSKIVYLSDKTQVFKSTLGATSDLVNDSNVVVMGTPGADGTVTAQSIQIRPAGMPSGFAGGRGSL